jgi:hypothetical protein
MSDLVGCLVGKGRQKGGSISSIVMREILAAEHLCWLADGSEAASWWTVEKGRTKVT